MTTAFTDLVGCTVPVQLAPMGGGISTPELAAAVCEAGGLGMISASGLLPLAAQITSLRELTSAPFGVGVFAFDISNRRDDFELAAHHARVVDVFWGEPDPNVVEDIHSGGALAFWQVGSVEEALVAADAGCDAVVAQGVEAGGHVRGTTPLVTLLGRIVPKVDVPVVAAGGVTTRDDVHIALDAGASAVRVGTRLVATTESPAHPDYLAAIVSAKNDADTELTTAFHVGWEDAPHRVLRQAVVAATSATEPIGWMGSGEHRWPIDRWSALPPSRSCSGEVTAMAMYAGTGVGAITEVLDVAEVISRLFDASP